MMEKTVNIDENLFQTLERNHLIDKYSSFSELVTNALELLIKEQKKEEYKKAMQEAMKDKLYILDMKEIEEDFKYVDSENL